MRCLKLFLSFLIMINLFACQSATQSKSSSYDQVPVNATDESLRTIILNDEELTEYESGQFISWKCRDYSDGSNVLVELGHIELIEEQLDTEAIEGMDGKTKPLLRPPSKTLNILIYNNKLPFMVASSAREGDIFTQKACT